MKITFSKCLKWLACILAVIAFGMMFANQLSHTLGVGDPIQLTFSQVLFGESGTKGAISAFIGYLLIILGGLVVGAMGCLFKNKKKINFLITLFSSVAITVGVFLVFNVGTAFVSKNPIYATGSTSLSTGPIAAGALGVVAALCGFISLSIDYNE